MLNQPNIFTGQPHGQRPARQRQSLVVGLLTLLALVLAACSAATPTSTPPPVPTNTPTSETAPTATSLPAPTNTLVPEATPTAAPLPAPTDTPVAEATPTPTLPPAPTSTPLAEPEVVPSVSAVDQGVTGSQLTIAEVVSNGPGWIVIHAQQDGKPGPILGYNPVTDGTNGDVAIAIDLSQVTGTLYAMLHADAGQVGTWEFPDGPDAPVKTDEAIVMTSFNLQVPEGNTEVSMVNFAFDPKVLVVRVGTTVTWVNQDGGVGHTTTSDTGLWDSGLFSGDGTFSFTFDQPGVYPYYCKPHGAPGGAGMAGTIVVIA